MRRKRLQHVADTLCHMFCGWELTFDYEELARLGSGTLVIDLISDRCTFNGQAISTLKIVGTLGAWLVKDLTDNKIPAESLRSVNLKAELEQGRVTENHRKTATLWSGGMRSAYIT